MILEPVVSPWRNRLITFCHGLPVSWAGRRLALIVRKIARKNLPLPVLAQVRGIRLRLYLTDNICERRFLFMPQFFDPYEFNLIATELPTDGVFVDIGANVGIYSLMAAKKLNSEGKILAIEPNPITFGRLSQNFDLNKIAAMHSLEAVGVGSEDGTLSLTLHQDNLGQASANPDFNGKSITVPCQRLTTLLQDNDIGKIDILKIDIEGFEDQALIPFFTTAAPNQYPRWIIIENSEHQWREDLLTCLKSHGYQLTKSTSSNHIFKLTR